MDYKEKYIAALERAKEMCAMPTDKATMEYIFPELKESEGERIRKKVIEVLKLNIKGAESQMQASRGVDRCFEIYACNKAIAWLEKQGKQKTADDVEPKFHEGDWVVNKLGDLWHIDSFDKKNYQVSDGKGNYNWFPISKQDEMHLWTIQDAKDGDVLVASDGSLFILSKVVGTAAFYYFSLCKNGSKEISDGNRAWETTRCCQPATKEQRDMLFRKMKEAGYEWDAEKKELKKIKPKKLDPDKVI